MIDSALFAKIMADLTEQVAAQNNAASAPEPKPEPIFEEWCLCSGCGGTPAVSTTVHGNVLDVTLTTSRVSDGSDLMVITLCDNDKEESFELNGSAEISEFKAAMKVLLA